MSGRWTHSRKLWASALQNPQFRRILLLELIALIACMLALWPFFDWVEQREGPTLYDPVLEILSPADHSEFIFLISYGLLAYLAFRIAQQPRLLVHYVGAYAIMLLFRMCTMTLVPLDPPLGYQFLRDPIEYFFYGGHPISKDLFFSGHTATALLVFWTLPGRRERAVVLTLSGLLVFLILKQHVHYTIDILAAVLFAWLSWRILRRVLGTHLDKIQE